MAEKIVTLYVDDASLRLMVTHGKRIKEWAELSLEPGLVENTVVIKQAEVAARIKQLFKARKVKTKKVIVGMSGLHCLSRPITLPRLPREMLEEAVKREAKRVLPVPLEQLYISWQTIPAPEGKIRVFLAAIPCKTADALLKAVHQAGLKPSFMDLKPLLLSRVVKEAMAVVVDVQKAEFDIVIMANGVPQPVRTIPFLNEVLSWQEKLTMIRNELDRTIAFYNSNNPDNPLASSVPVFASGDLASESELCQALSDELGHPVLLLPSPLECSEGFDPSRYMVNIGLTLQDRSLRKEAGPSVARLNVLPTPYLPKPISLINIFALPGAVIAVGSLVFLVLFIQSASADIALLHAQFNTTDQLLQQKLSQRQELARNVAELQKKITEIKVSHDNCTAALDTLETQGKNINRNLEATIENLPDTISLSNISCVTSNLTITGRAPSEKEVVLYLRNLDASGRFGEITTTSMDRIEDQGVDFTLVDTFEKQSDRARVIEVAVSSLPATVSLTSASYTNGTLTMNGRSPDEVEVLSYLEDLEAGGEFGEITITSMTRIEDGGMDFFLVLKVGE